MSIHFASRAPRALARRWCAWLFSQRTGMRPATRPATRLAAILLVALAARAVTFGNPILHVDEQFYFVAATRWLHGALPYVGIWDRKPIGLFLLYLPAAACGPAIGIWVYQAMALASVVATGWTIMRAAERAGWGRGALAGALAYVLWIDLVEGEGGQAPVFYNLPVALAAVLIVPRGGALPSRGRGLLAMALVGCALQIKYSVVFEGLFFGVWLLWCDWRRGRRLPVLPYAAALVALAALPTVIAWVSYRAIGAEDAWVFANVTSILRRVPDPPRELFFNFASLVAIVSPLFAAVVVGRKLGEGGVATRAARRWLHAWLAAASIGVLAFGYYFDHYALPLLVPAAIGASAFFGYHRTGRRIALPLLAFIFLGGQIMLLVKLYNRGTPAQFAQVTAAIAAVDDRVRGCLFVYSGETMSYVRSDRCSPTRYLFPSHFGSRRENGAVGVGQAAELRRIMATRPAIVTLRPLYSGEDPARHALVVGLLRRDYRVRRVLKLGHEPIAILERRD